MKKFLIALAGLLSMQSAILAQEDNPVISVSPSSASGAVSFSGGFPQNAVIEEATGTWCGYCPKGIVMCEYIREHYSDRMFPIAIHQGDKMEIEDYSQFLAKYVSYYPMAMINRSEEMDISTQAADLLYNQIKDQLTYARVNVTARIENNVLFIDSETEFAANLNSEHRLAFVVVEDGVGPYAQTNYFTGTDTGLGMWEDAGSRVFCYFNDVTREIKTFDGIKGSLPNSVKAGEKYNYSTEIELTNLSSPACKVIAMIIDCDSESVVNSCQYSVEAPQGLYINKSLLYMTIGDKEKLSVFFNGIPVDDNSASWSSSDESVVTVDNNGNIEAVGLGQAVVTFSSDAGSVQCQVYVELTGSIFEIDGIRYKLTGSKTCMVALPKEGEQYMMEKIVIPSHIEVIGRTFEVSELEFSLETFRGAFYNSPNLVEIELPNTITILPGDVFDRCDKLKKFKAPSSINIIDAYAFYLCSSLTDVELNEGLWSLWSWSFGVCSNLKTIVLPSTLQRMGREVFNYTHPYWIHSKALVPPLLYGDLFNDEYLTEDFENCALVVPESSLDAYKNAEYWNRFEMIVPDDVILNQYKITSNRGFEYNLEVVNNDGAPVTWSSGNPDVVSVDDNGKITTLAVGETTVTAKCKDKTASCKVIVTDEDQTFESGDLWYVIKGKDTCSVIRNQSSDENYLIENVTVPSEVEYSGRIYEVTQISSAAFSWCLPLKEIIFPNTIKSIGSSAFNMCPALTEIVLNEGLEKIGARAFANCSTLESIVLPSTLNDIGFEVFYGDSISLIQCKAIVPPLVKYDLFDRESISPEYSDCVLVVPTGSVNLYKEADCWKRFEMIVPDDVILNRYKLKMNPGDEFQLAVLNSDGMQIAWNSNYPETVTVNSDGKLVALSCGEAIVTAECKGATAQCLITVSNDGGTGGVDRLYISHEDMNIYDIYTADGQILKMAVPISEIQGLPRGFYLIRQNGKTIKLIK